MGNKYIQKIKELVLDYLKDEEVKIVLFGSRARKDSSIFSDVDIGVMSYGKLDETRLILLREKVENLNIPYKVEIVNFSEVSPEFKEEALREIIVWKE